MGFTDRISAAASTPKDSFENPANEKRALKDRNMRKQEILIN